MNQKGYALLAVIGITALLMALSLLSFQAAQVQSISLISEGRAKASTNEAVAALSALIRTLDRPSLAQRLSPSTFLSTLRNEVCNPGGAVPRWGQRSIGNTGGVAETESP